MTNSNDWASPEVVRLAESCGLATDTVCAVLQHSQGLVAAARLLRPEQAWAAFGTSAADPWSSAPNWLVWLSAPVWTPRSASTRPVPARDGTLSLRYIGDGLPVVVLALFAEAETIVVAVPVWDAQARDWLYDIVTRQSFSLVIEPCEAGDPTFVRGRFQLPQRTVQDLFDFEFSVDGPDRGHALRSAAVIAMAVRDGREPLNCRDAHQQAVGVVTGNLADLSELAVLQSLLE